MQLAGQPPRTTTVARTVGDQPAATRAAKSAPTVSAAAAAVFRGQVAAALVKALAMAGPRSPHGQLLVAALSPAAAPRPAAEWAVRVLLRYGQVPTPAAVLGRVAQRDQHERAMVARAQARRHAVALRLSDGPAAAALMARQWEAQGTG